MIYHKVCSCCFQFLHFAISVGHSTCFSTRIAPHQDIVWGIADDNRILRAAIQRLQYLVYRLRIGLRMGYIVCRNNSREEVGDAQFGEQTVQTLVPTARSYSESFALLVQEAERINHPEIGLYRARDIVLVEYFAINRCTMFSFGSRKLCGDDETFGQR